MSTCISRHGEYSEHVLAAEGKAADRFVCSRCFAVAEDDLFDALDAAEAEIARLRKGRGPAVRGHGLVREGRAHDAFGAFLPKPRRGASVAGHAVCACGAMSPELPTDSARKRWHAGHKLEVA